MQEKAHRQHPPKLYYFNKVSVIIIGGIRVKCSLEVGVAWYLLLHWYRIAIYTLSNAHNFCQRAQTNTVGRQLTNKHQLLSCHCTYMVHSSCIAEGKNGCILKTNNNKVQYVNITYLEPAVSLIFTFMLCLWQHTGFWRLYTMLTIESKMQNAE